MNTSAKTREKYEHSLLRFYQLFAQMSAEIEDLKRQLIEARNGKPHDQ